jgi:hypothetical protein
MGICFIDVGKAPKGLNRLDPIGEAFNPGSGANVIQQRGQARAGKDQGENAAHHTAAYAFAHARLAEVVAVAFGFPSREAGKRRLDGEHELNDAVL